MKKITLILVTLFFGFSAVAQIVITPACGDIFTDLGGTDEGYPVGANYTVTICPENDGDMVTVTFTSFSILPNNDGLYIYDGINTSSPMIPSGNGPGFNFYFPAPGAYWGNISPGSITATNESGCITFEFFSDIYENDYTGWEATVSCAPPTTCPAPTDITSSNPTPNSFDINWTPVGEATQWKVFAVPCGSAVPTFSSEGGFLSNAPSYSFTDLEPITCYQIYVFAICSETDISTIVGPYATSTLVTPPACGGQFTDSGGSNGNYGPSNSALYVICPENASEVVTVSFSSFELEEAYDGVYIYDGDSIDAPLIASENLSGNTDDLQTPGAYWGSGNIGSFEGTSTSGCLTFQFFSDEYTEMSGWEATVECGPPPTCRRPSNVVLYQSSDTTIRASWTPQSSESQWMVIALPCGSPIPDVDDPAGQLATSAPTAGNPFVYTGLDPLSCYDLYVFAICSESDSSNPTNPRSITTQIAPPKCGDVFTDAGGIEGNFALGTDSIITICPENGSEKVIVDFTSFDLMEGYDAMYVYDGDSVLAPPLLSQNQAGYETIVNPGGFWGTQSPGTVEATSASGCLTFRFISNEFVESAGWTADVTCVPVGSCQKPTAVVLEESNYTTISLSWTSVGQASQWMVVPVACGSPVPTVDNPAGQLATFLPTAENPFILTGLETYTCFEVYVFAVCSPTDSSEPTLPIQTITILNLPVCGGIFTDAGGIDGNYIGGTEEIVTICPENPGDVVTVNFTDFNVRPGFDGLYIYDGSSTDAPQILSSSGPGMTEDLQIAGAFSGTTLPGSFTSAPDGCLTFKFVSLAGNLYSGWAATVTCGPPPACSKPTMVTSSAITESSVTVDWQETGTATAWQVLVIPITDPEPNSSNPGWQIATSHPYVYNGLEPNQLYKIYVRASCGEQDFSSFSNIATFSTPLTNDDCTDAINVPVNAGMECILVAHGIFAGATDSGIPMCEYTPVVDVWFKFTATETVHNIFSPIVGIGGVSASLYSGECGSLTYMACLQNINALGENVYNLIPGNTYYLQLSSANNLQSATVCIKTLNLAYVDIDSTYSVDTLVNDVLLQGSCVVPTNVTSFTEGPATSTYGIAYFNKNGTDFPIEEGVLLSTCDAELVWGPNISPLHDVMVGHTWDGDMEAAEMYAESNGVTVPLWGVSNASKIEFDFVPATPLISFDYVYGSDGYGGPQCFNTNTFAFILTDLTAGTEGVNHALVPNTTLSISENTIRDQSFNAFPTSCESENAEYFGNYYGHVDSSFSPPEAINPFLSPTNFAGLTLPLTASAVVIPGHSYHIKLVVTKIFAAKYDAGAFIGKLNLGQVELGEHSVTICDTPSYEIVSGLNSDQYSFVWKNGAVVIANQTGSSLTVTESGVYTVSATYLGTECTTTDTVTVTILDPIDLDDVANVSACGSFEVPVPSVGHYYSAADGQGDILDGTSITAIGDTTLFLYATNDLNCVEQESFVVTISNEPVFPEINDVVSCGTYNLPQVDNVSYYEQQGATGVPITSVSSSQTVFAYMTGATAGCSAEQSFDVSVTELSEIEISANCNVNDYILTATILNSNSQVTYTYVWTTDAGTVISGGDSANVTVSGQGTYSVTVSASLDCNGEAQQVVASTMCTIQKGISANNDGNNDVFDLTGYDVQKLEIYNRYGSLVYDRVDYTDEWGGQSNNGAELPDGTYYYVISLESSPSKTGWIYILRQN